jgi:hypothetical protein
MAGIVAEVAEARAPESRFQFNIKDILKQLFPALDIPMYVTSLRFATDYYFICLMVNGMNTDSFIMHTPTDFHSSVRTLLRSWK